MMNVSAPLFGWKTTTGTHHEQFTAQIRTAPQLYCTTKLTETHRTQTTYTELESQLESVTLDEDFPQRPSLAVRRPAPARPLPAVQPEVCVEVSRLVEALPADVAAERFLPGVDAVVPLQHADRGEALAAHGAAVRLLLRVPAHVHLQLAGEAEALPTLFTAVPLLHALGRVGRPRHCRLHRTHALDPQQVRALLCVCLFL